MTWLVNFSKIKFITGLEDLTDTRGDRFRLEMIIEGSVLFP